MLYFSTFFLYLYRDIFMFGPLQVFVAYCMDYVDWGEAGGQVLIT